jgi:abortive infection bacteriophage resistance protein
VPLLASVLIEDGSVTVARHQIKAYSIGLKPVNGNYYNGISSNILADIYMFNARLRQILFPLIEEIEITLRCNISNYISIKYGNLGYENEDYFQNSIFHRNLLDELKKEINRNNTSFVKNFRNNYEEAKLPFYAAIELFSFGMLSKFFGNLKAEDKKAIARDNYNLGYTYFESWINSISFVRNICAHYGRLYNVKLVIQPVLYKEYRAVSNYRIFAVILCMKHIIKNEMLWLTFKNDLVSLVEKYSNSINLEYIGFIDRWENLI